MFSIVGKIIMTTASTSSGIVIEVPSIETALGFLQHFDGVIHHIQTVTMGLAEDTMVHHVDLYNLLSRYVRSLPPRRGCASEFRHLVMEDIRETQWCVDMVELSQLLDPVTRSQDRTDYFFRRWGGTRSAKQQIQAVYEEYMVQSYLQYERHHPNHERTIPVDVPMSTLYRKNSKDVVKPIVDRLAELAMMFFTYFQVTLEFVQRMIDSHFPMDSKQQDLLLEYRRNVDVEMAYLNNIEDQIHEVRGKRKEEHEEREE